MLATGVRVETDEGRWSGETLVNPDLNLTTGLSVLEVEILQLVAVGHADDEIGRELSLAEKIVARVTRAFFKKISAPDRFQAALWAGKYL